jgi:hypothetical protein
LTGQRKLHDAALRCLVRNTTIPPIKEYLKEHPDQVAEVLEAEEHGLRRASLINWCWDRLIMARRAAEVAEISQ